MPGRWLKMLLIAGICSIAQTSFAGVYAPKVGQPHPEFTLPRISDREPMSLSQFRGKKVLLIQFASW